MGIDELKAAWNAQADRYNHWDELGLDEIVAFAKAVEREACAKLCDRLANDTEPDDFALDAVNDAAIAIRMRSNV